MNYFLVFVGLQKHLAPLIIAGIFSSTGIIVSESDNILVKIFTFILNYAFTFLVYQLSGKIIGPFSKNTEDLEAIRENHPDLYPEAVINAQMSNINLRLFITGVLYFTLLSLVSILQITLISKVVFLNINLEKMAISYGLFFLYLIMDISGGIWLHEAGIHYKTEFFTKLITISSVVGLVGGLLYLNFY